jgi:epoxyqueuosine reductase
MSITRDKLRQKAFELGFSAAGMVTALPLEERSGLQPWLRAGFQGEMHWMERQASKRMDPRQVLPEVKSILSVALNYYSPQLHSNSPHHGIISRYAWGTDYHILFEEKIKQLCAWIVREVPDSQVIYSCDTGPLMDKIWAHRAGIGWIGKHSNLIIPKAGSWVFLGEILSNLELEYDSESKNYCGRCDRCLKACPTGAIVAPYLVDARLCISYLTIELRGPIPRHLRSLLGRRIFGCDDCQDACPWNRFAKPSSESSFQPMGDNRAPDLVKLMEISEEEFRKRFRSSPIWRAKYHGFLRNVAVALGNSGSLEAIPALLRQSHHPAPLVRGHIAWSLGKIGENSCLARLKAWLTTESDLYVREEIQEALNPLDGLNEPHTNHNPSSPDKREPHSLW